MTAPLRSQAVLMLVGLVLYLLPRPCTAGQATETGRRMKQAREGLEADISSARGELASLREKIESRRTEMVKRLEKLRDNVRSLEQKLSRRREEREKREEKLQTVRARTQNLQDTAGFMVDAVSEFRRGFETRLSAARAHSLRARLDRIDENLHANDLLKRLKTVPETLQLARDHLEAAVGGSRFDGKAVGEDGRIYQGTYAQVGPVSYFAAREGPAGLAVQQAGNVEPTLFTDFASSAAQQNIGRLVAEGSAKVPVDPTLGSAIKLAQSEGGWIEHLRKGGITMIPLLGLALACGCIAIYKLVILHLVDAGQNEEKVSRVLDALRRDNPAKARDIASDYRPPLGPVLVEGIEHRNAPKEQIEEIMYERLLSQTPSLKRFLSALSVCASVAPLLGLLGTVTGMIHTFQLITVFGTGEASTLSSGISEALVTTEFGLIIAVPALIIHAYLSRRVEKAISRSQQAAIMFVNGVKLRQDTEG